MNGLITITTILLFAPDSTEVEGVHAVSV